MRGKWINVFLLRTPRGKILFTDIKRRCLPKPPPVSKHKGADPGLRRKTKPAANNRTYRPRGGGLRRGYALRRSNPKKALRIRTGLLTGLEGLFTDEGPRRNDPAPIRIPHTGGNTPPSVSSMAIASPIKNGPQYLRRILPTDPTTNGSEKHIARIPVTGRLGTRLMARGVSYSIVDLPPDENL
jgi:hypothetical protein